MPTTSITCVIAVPCKNETSHMTFPLIAVTLKTTCYHMQHASNVFTPL